MTRVAIYARFSSELQNNASIDDQVRLCKEIAHKEGWQIVMTYSDYALSGSSMNRSGMQSLMQDAALKQFDMVLTEGLDRLSRDQENLAGIYKRLNFYGVQIYSVTNSGFATDMHIAFDGLKNSQYLKDLAHKTKRGQRGRVEQGKFAAGRAAYGYSLVRRFDSKGEPVRGERKINPEQAHIVKRIFEEYASGKSPRAIAKALNQEGIFNAQNKPWQAQAIVGRKAIGEGMINNELYIGKMVWNKRSFALHPETGQRIARANAQDERVIHEVPELRIIDQALWDKAKAQQQRISQKDVPHQKRRPKGLFSYLIKCGRCDGGYSKISASRYGCTTAHKKGLCDNRKTIDQRKLEQAILSGLQSHLMKPDLYKAFRDAYTQHMSALNKHSHKDIELAKRALKKLENENTKLIEAIKQGVPAEAIKDEFARIAVKKEQTHKRLAQYDIPTVPISADLASRYQHEVQELRQTLNNNADRHEAMLLIRSMVDKILLVPDEDNKKLVMSIYGDLAGLLHVASGGEITQGHALVQSFNDETVNQLPFSQVNRQEVSGSRAVTRRENGEAALRYCPSDRRERV